MSNNFSYDVVPYQSTFQPQIFPDRMATLAALLGMKPAAVENCRYLELGCGDGENLLAFAFLLPDSEFVGIDLSAKHIEMANRAVAELGLKNIKFLQLDVLKIDSADFSQFDFIAAHGLFSWVSDVVRQKILALYSDLLAPSGICYLSYNVLPGGYLRQMMRDMMQYHTQNEPLSLDKVQKGLSMLGFLKDSTGKDAYYQTILKNEIDFVTNHDASSVLHDELGETNQAFYFHEFAELAAQNDLQYLAETDYYQLPMYDFAPEIKERIDSFDDLIRREQYVDFLRLRRFRQTLLCRADVKLNRTVESSKIREFYIAASSNPVEKNAELEKNQPDKFRFPNATIELVHPLTKIALAHLGNIWTRSIKFDELMSLSRQMLEEKAVIIEDWEKETEMTCRILLELYNRKMIELHAYQPNFAREVSEFPCLSPLARWQLGYGDKVTTMNNNQVKIDDSFFKNLLLLLDGTRSKLDLKKELRKKISAGEFSDVGEKSALLGDLPQLLNENLKRVAELGLLIS